MKKILLFILVSFFFMNSGAQELLNKKGQKILPQAGNWAVGFDVIPFLKYAGNIFYNSGDSTRDFSLKYPLAFTGKYVKKDNLAYRAGLRLGYIGSTKDSLVPKTSSTNVNEKVSNETKERGANIYISGGVEKRKGLGGRVTGIYGIEAGFSLKTHKTTYTYGNPLNVNDQLAEQIVSVKDGSTFGLGLRGFLGAEFFIASHLSLSAEYGMGPFISSRGRGSIETEVVDGNTTKVEISETDKAFLFGFDNDINGGSVTLTFYF
jgi:hypothetical protein